MNAFTLSERTLTLLTAQLNLNGSFHHCCRSACSRHSIMFRLKVERGPASTETTVELGGQRHSLTLPHGELRPAHLLADFVEAVANGRLDSAEPAPARLLAAPLAEEEAAPLLDSDQQRQLRRVVRGGGFLALQLGHSQPIRVAIHRNRPRPGVTGILAMGETQPRTILLANYENSEERLYARIVEAVEQLSLAALPAAGAA